MRDRLLRWASPEKNQRPRRQVVAAGRVSLGTGWWNRIVRIEDDLPAAGRWDRRQREADRLRVGVEQDEQRVVDDPLAIFVELDHAIAAQEHAQATLPAGAPVLV